MTVDLSGKFGMCEMESAAALMIANGIDNPFCVTMCNTDHERIGFVELVHCGWVDRSGHSIERYLYNGQFVATQKMKDRINEADNRNDRSHTIRPDR